MDNCEWDYKGGIMLFSGCGESYHIPKEKYIFCPKCGKRIVHKPTAKGENKDG